MQSMLESLFVIIKINAMCLAM